MAWTEEQKQAIDVEGNNVIVSAGAGSGKTAVLSERVLRKLKSGVHINELLILTFTNAAAFEMKDRIRKRILETEEVKDEVDLIDGAYITTFDSFALSVVKKYHTRLNITNNPKITDQVIIELEMRKILDEIFDENYLSPKKNFMNLINNFCLKDDKELKDYIINIYKKIELKYDKENYLENYFSLDGSIDNYDIFINKYLNILLEKKELIRNLIDDLNSYFDADFVLKVEDNFKKLLNANTIEEFASSLDYQTIRLPRNSDKEGSRVKNTIFSLASEIKDLCIYNSKDEMKNELLDTREDLEVIIDILKNLDKRLEEYKNNNEVYNFTDISRLAIKVVEENEDIREELKNQFKEILVDEYQDTNDTQEMFISLISDNNVYMVGDIKQSIYRFRNANPYLFKEKYDSYSNTSNGIKIDLVKNFRSRKEVLDNINLLFDLFMDDTLGGADYKKSHRMVFGNETYINEGMTNQDYNLDVITYSNDLLNGITKTEEEAFIIANDIKEKIKNNYQIFDKEDKILRNIEYDDCVILLDRSKDFDTYKKIFEYLQVPLSILKDESLTNDRDILIIRNLLRLLICIKEERFDLEFRYTYTSICRSYLYRLSDEEIYDIFVNDKFKTTELYNKCLKLVEKQDEMNLSSYLLYILDEFNYEEKLLTVGNIKSFRVRLEYLYNLCCDYEDSGKTIYDFVSYLNEIFDKDYDLKFNINTSGVNSVKIMTIHKSKGLEFPICYFAGFSSKFNINELKEKIIYDNKYGIILPKVDGYYKDTILKTLLKIDTKHEEISERIRLLYVALTRAKEKMIIVIPKVEEEVEATDLVPIYEREKYNSFLAIIKSIYSALLPYEKESNIVGNKDYLKIVNNSVLNEVDEKIDVKEIEIDSNLIEEKHYSKESLHLVEKAEKEIMEFGVEVHEILEEIDFNDYNLDDYDISIDVAEKIKAFVNSDFMKDKLNLNMYKEYEFLYEEDNTLSHGIIDLLLEDKDKMIIVDYKLKNIDDPLYDKQLNGYRKYIEEKTKKDTYCYLYSILGEKYREVK